MPVSPAYTTVTARPPKPPPKVVPQGSLDLDSVELIRERTRSLPNNDSISTKSGGGGSHQKQRRHSHHQYESSKETIATEAQKVAALYAPALRSAATSESISTTASETKRAADRLRQANFLLANNPSLSRSFDEGEDEAREEEDGRAEKSQANRREGGGDDREDGGETERRKSAALTRLERDFAKLRSASATSSQEEGYNVYFSQTTTEDSILEEVDEEAEAGPKETRRARRASPSKKDSHQPKEVSPIEASTETVKEKQDDADTNAAKAEVSIPDKTGDGDDADAYSNPDTPTASPPASILLVDKVPNDLLQDEQQQKVAPKSRRNNSNNNNNPPSKRLAAASPNRFQRWISPRRHREPDKPSRNSSNNRNANKTNNGSANNTSNKSGRALSARELLRRKSNRNKPSSAATKQDAEVEKPLLLEETAQAAPASTEPQQIPDTPPPPPPPPPPKPAANNKTPKKDESHDKSEQEPVPEQEPAPLLAEDPLDSSPIAESEVSADDVPVEAIAELPVSVGPNEEAASKEPPPQETEDEARSAPEDKLSSIIVETVYTASTDASAAEQQDKGMPTNEKTSVPMEPITLQLDDADGAKQDSPGSPRADAEAIPETTIATATGGPEPEPIEQTPLSENNPVVQKQLPSGPKKPNRLQRWISPKRNREATTEATATREHNNSNDSAPKRQERSGRLSRMRRQTTPNQSSREKTKTKRKDGSRKRRAGRSSRRGAAEPDGSEKQQPLGDMMKAPEPTADKVELPKTGSASNDNSALPGNKNPEAPPPPKDCDDDDEAPSSTDAVEPDEKQGSPVADWQSESPKKLPEKQEEHHDDASPDAAAPQESASGSKEKTAASNTDQQESNVVADNSPAGGTAEEAEGKLAKDNDTPQEISNQPHIDVADVAGAAEKGKGAQEYAAIRSEMLDDVAGIAPSNNNTPKTEQPKKGPTVGTSAKKSSRFQRWISPGRSRQQAEKAKSPQKQQPGRLNRWSNGRKREQKAAKRTPTTPPSKVPPPPSTSPEKETTMKLSADDVVQVQPEAQQPEPQETSKPVKVDEAVSRDVTAEPDVAEEQPEPLPEVDMTTHETQQLDQPVNEESLTEQMAAVEEEAAEPVKDKGMEGESPKLESEETSHIASGSASGSKGDDEAAESGMTIQQEIPRELSEPDALAPESEAASGVGHSDVAANSSDQMAPPDLDKAESNKLPDAAAEADSQEINERPGQDAETDRQVRESGGESNPAAMSPTSLDRRVSADDDNLIESQGSSSRDRTSPADNISPAESQGSTSRDRAAPAVNEQPTETQAALTADDHPTESKGCFSAPQDSDVHAEAGCLSGDDGLWSWILPRSSPPTQASAVAANVKASASVQTSTSASEEKTEREMTMEVLATTARDLEISSPEKKQETEIVESTTPQELESAGRESDSVTRVSEEKGDDPDAESDLAQNRDTGSSEAEAVQSHTDEAQGKLDASDETQSKMADDQRDEAKDTRAPEEAPTEAAESPEQSHEVAAVQEEGRSEDAAVPQELTSQAAESTPEAAESTPEAAESTPEADVVPDDKPDAKNEDVGKDDFRDEEENPASDKDVKAAKSLPNSLPMPSGSKYLEKAATSFPDENSGGSTAVAALELQRTFPFTTEEANEFAEWGEDVSQAFASSTQSALDQIGQMADYVSTAANSLQSPTEVASKAGLREIDSQTQKDEYAEETATDTATRTDMSNSTKPSYHPSDDNSATPASKPAQGSKSTRRKGRAWLSRRANKADVEKPNKPTFLRRQRGKADPQQKEEQAQLLTETADAANEESRDVCVTASRPGEAKEGAANPILNSCSSDLSNTILLQIPSMGEELTRALSEGKKVVLSAFSSTTGAKTAKITEETESEEKEASVDRNAKVQPGDSQQKGEVVFTGVLEKKDTTSAGTKKQPQTTRLNWLRRQAQRRKKSGQVKAEAAPAAVAGQSKKVAREREAPVKIVLAEKKSSRSKKGLGHEPRTNASVNTAISTLEKSKLPWEDSCMEGEMDKVEELLQEPLKDVDRFLKGSVVDGWAEFIEKEVVNEPEASIDSRSSVSSKSGERKGHLPSVVRLG